MKFRKTAVAFLLLAAALWTVSCGGKESSENEQAGETAGTTTAGDAAFKDPRVVLSVNGEEITAGDVEAESARIFRSFGGQVSPFQAEEKKDEIHQQAQDNLVNKILLENAAADRGLAIDDEEMQETLEGYKSRFPDDETFQKSIADMGMSEDEFIEGWRSTLLIQKMLGAVVAEMAGVTEEKKTAHYAENREKYVQEEQVKASHILLLFGEGETEEEKQKKLVKAGELRQEALQGADFATLATENSGCPSAKNGGDLGWFGRNRMVEPFEEAAFAMQVGDVSGVVETQFGYHVIKLTDRKESRPLSYDEAALYVEQELIDEKMDRDGRKKAIDELLLGLREKAEIVVINETG